MEMRGRRVLLCNCEETMPLDAKGLEKACRAVGATGDLTLDSQLCRAQLGNFQQALLGDQPVIVGCTQEAPLFSEVAEESNPQAEVAHFDIRETAGWSAEAESRDATAKIAALLAEAALEIPGDAVGGLRIQGHLPGLRQGREGHRSRQAALRAPRGDGFSSRSRARSCRPG